MEITTGGIAVGAIIAAVINVGANYFIQKKETEQKKEDNVNLLFGELLNILCHYQLSEIPIKIVDGDERNLEEIDKRMNFAKYGSFEAIENVALYGFLSAVQIRNIHQLALKIRNTDTLIATYFSNYSTMKNSSTSEIQLVYDINSRMGYVADTAGLLLSYISEQHPEFKPLIQETKELKNQNYEI